MPRLPPMAPGRKRARAPLEFATLAVHAGSDLPPPRTPPLGLPIHRTSSYRFASSAEVRRYGRGERGGLYLYSRYENPTVRAVERRLAALEGAEEGLLFSTGMAAITTALLAHLSAGETLLASSELYGGTHRLLRDELPRLGIGVELRSSADLLRGLWPKRVKVVYTESPTNPSLRLIDLARLSSRARDAGAILIVDGTFATPVLQRPLALGADLVIHSATKALGGHSDLLAGAVLGGRARLLPVERLRRAFGGTLAPDEAYLLGRSLETLPLRVARQSATAAELARRLERDRRVFRVLYPGLRSHPDHRLALRQMPGFGGMVTLELAGGLRAARRLFDRLELIARATSLGGTESLASLPVESSHAGFGAAALAGAGVTRGMVRLSIGLEGVEDLWHDLDRALGG